MMGGSQTGTDYGSGSGSGSGSGMEMGSGSGSSSGSEALLAADGSYLAGLAMGESIKTTLSRPILGSAMLGSAVFVVLLPFLHL